jgi:tight adherence protein B
VIAAGWLLLAAVALGFGGGRRSPRAARLAELGRLRRGPAEPAGAWQWAVPPARVLAVMFVGGFGAGGLALGGVPLAIAGAAVGALLGVLAGDVGSGRAAAVRRRDLHTALRVLVGELEAGSGPGIALAAAGAAGPSVREPFAEAARAAERGEDAGAVLADVAPTPGNEGLRAIGVAWQVGETTGAELAGVLGRVAADLAAAREQRRAVDTALAGPRSSATLLAGLPLVGIGLGLAMGAQPLDFLTRVPSGRLVCCAGVLLDAAGVLWMRAILHRAARP